MTSPGEKPAPSDKVAEIIILTVDVEKVARSFGFTDRQVAAIDRLIAKGRLVMDRTTGMIVIFRREPGTRSPSPSTQGEPEAAR